MHSVIRILLCVIVLLAARLPAFSQNPVVSTTAATLVTDISAKLNGTVTQPIYSSQAIFEYGLTSTYGKSATASVPFSGTTRPVSLIVGGLLPNATYHFRLGAPSYNSAYIYGPDMIFTTGNPLTLPTTGAVSLVNIGTIQATVKCASVSAGASPATVTFEYGLTTSYGGTASYPSILATGTAATPTVTISSLSPGATYHYRCKATNDQGTAVSSDATFSTPQTETVATNAASGKTDHSVTLNGTAFPTGSAIPVSFEYGTTTSYGQSATPTPSSASGTNPIAFAANLTTLLPNTSYHYRAIATSGGYQMVGNDAVFTTGQPATPPTLGTPSVDLTTATSARVFVSNAFSGSSSASVSFEYGSIAAYTSQSYSTVVAAGSTSSSVSASLSGLVPGTTYHYRCKAYNDEGTTYTADAVFTTLAVPVLVTTSASGVTDSSASLSGTANPSEGNLRLYFEYGTTIAYGSSLYPTGSSLSGSSTSSLAGVVSSLLPNTTYHFRITGSDDSGTYYYGSDATFTTASSSPAPPSVTTGSSSSVRATSTYAAGNTISAGSADATFAIEYGLTTAYGMQTASSSLLTARSTSSQRSVQLVGLQSGTTYHYRAVCTSSVGAAYGSDATFTALPAPLVVTGAASGVTDLSASLAGSVNASGGSYSVSLDYGPTTAYGRVATTTPSSVSGTVAANFSTSPPGLLPGTIYHYRMRVTDGITTFYGGDATFSTLPAATLPSVTTAAASAVAVTTATLNAVNLKSGASSASVVFEYGLTTAYDNSIPYSTFSANRTLSSINAGVSGLSASTTYHYRVVVTNSQGTTAGTDMTFTTTALPLLAGAPATFVTSSSATLNAIANPNGALGNVSFELGTDTRYGQVLAPSDPLVAGSSRVFIGSNATQLLPSTTYHYRLRMEIAGSVFYGTDTVFATMPASGSAPTISYVSASPDATTASLSASIASGSSAADVFFEYGTTIAYGNTISYPGAVPAGASRSISASPFQLVPLTTYHYRVRASNAQGVRVSGDGLFTTMAKPTVICTGVSGVTDIRANVSGIANPAGRRDMSVSFHYRPEGQTYDSYAYPASSSISGSSDITLSATLSGLLPGTTYRCRLTGGNFSSESISFTTAGPGTQPSFNSQSSSSLSATSVQLNSSINPGGFATTVAWEYGLTSSYGSEAADSDVFQPGSSASASAVLTGLTPATTYHYRSRAIYPQGVMYASDAVFTTAPVLNTATTLPATQIQNSSATLNGSFLSTATSSVLSFQWGSDGTYGATVAATPATAVASTMSQSGSAPLSGLAPGQLYHYRIVSSAGDGDAYGDDMTFSTLPNANGPLVKTATATGSASGAATFRGTVNANGFPTTAVVEYGPTTEYGSVVTAQPAPLGSTGDLEVSVFVSGLSPNATYHYRVVATNAFANRYGEDATVRTVDPPSLLGTSVSARSTSAMLWPAFSFLSFVSGSGYYEYGLSKSYGMKSSGVTFYGGPVFIGDRYNLPPDSGWQLGDPLIPVTTYHYRLVMTGDWGVAYSADATFTTDHPEAVVSYKPVTNITSTSATLNVQVTENGGYDYLTFSYGQDYDYGNTIPADPWMTATLGTTPASATLTGLKPGTTYRVRLDAMRLNNSATFTYSAGDQTFTTLTQLENWRQQHFNSSANSGVGADLAAPNGDGIANLLKYALVLEPGTTSTFPTPVLQDGTGGKRLTMSFQRDPARSDVSIFVESTDNLTDPWVIVGSSLSVAPFAGPGLVSDTEVGSGLNQIVIRDTVNQSDATARFMRVRVQR